LAKVSDRPRSTSHPSQLFWRGATLLGLGLFLVLGLARSSTAQPLPAYQTYPIPESLATIASGDDYFDKLTTTPVGALIWTDFPVTVAIDLAESRAPREDVWLKSVRQAIADWQQSLPLVETTDLTQANIIVRRASVPIQRGKDGKLQRIRLAETRFAFFTDAAQRLRQKMTIVLSPNQADAALVTGARHELGHALGLWGHSDRVNDVMYFSQVSQPVGISDRDLRTLKRIYEIPTRLGGQVIPPK
jgi:predicted Zn-dependent protease